MALQVIGKTFTNGFAGMFARQPDQVIDTRIADASGVAFGLPVKYDASGNITTFGSGDAATAFLGIVCSEVKTTAAGSNGAYAPGEPTAVMKRGRVNVKCNVGTPALNGDVYVRIVANALIPDGVVGEIEASADSTNTIKLTNAKFGGAADANGIVELEILYPINA